MTLREELVMFQLLLMVGKLEWLFGDAHNFFCSIERGERSDYTSTVGGWDGFG